MKIITLLNVAFLLRNGFKYTSEDSFCITINSQPSNDRKINSTRKGLNSTPGTITTIVRLVRPRAVGIY